MRTEHACQCPCGATRFTVSGEPLLRAICHCSICQTFNESAYADITVYNQKQLRLPDDYPVEFKTYRKPPAVQRGKCSQCAKPAIEFLRLPVLPDIVFVPTANLPAGAGLAEPSMHIFYEGRRTDVQDALPKYQGYWPSQIAFLRRIAVAGLRRR